MADVENGQEVELDLSDVSRPPAATAGIASMPGALQDAAGGLRAGTVPWLSGRQCPPTLARRSQSGLLLGRRTRSSPSTRRPPRSATVRGWLGPVSRSLAAACSSSQPCSAPGATAAAARDWAQFSLCAGMAAAAGAGACNHRGTACCCRCARRRIGVLREQRHSLPWWRPARTAPRSWTCAGPATSSSTSERAAGDECRHQSAAAAGAAAMIGGCRRSARLKAVRE